MSSPAGVGMVAEPVCGGAGMLAGDVGIGAAGAIGSVGGIGCAISVGGGGGGGGALCAKVTVANSKALPLTAVRKGLRNFMIDTPCQNAGKVAWQRNVVPRTGSRYPRQTTLPGLCKCPPTIINVNP